MCSFSLDVTTKRLNKDNEMITIFLSKCTPCMYMYVKHKFKVL